MRRSIVRSRRRCAAALLALCGAALARPGAAAACTKLAYPGALADAVLLATALSDTVLAGPPPDDRALSQRVAQSSRRVHGQAVRVSRVAGPGAGALRQALAAGAEVVLVPWATESDCLPKPWERGARWVEPGTAGVFRARLRDRRHWVGGRPTLDAYEPIVYSEAVRERERAADPLTLEEFFALQALLPTWDEARSDPAAFDRLFGWARANPRQALRVPARHVLANAAVEASSARSRLLETPLGGTWRLTVSVPGQPDATVFLRTARHPERWDTMTATAPRTRTVADLLPRAAPGYRMRVEAASSPDELPRSAGEARLSAAAGWLLVVERPAPGADGGRVWHGRIDLGGGSGFYFPGEAVERVWKSRACAWAAGMPQGWTPAVFRQRRDGTVTVEQTMEAGGRVACRVRGEKVSERRAPWDSWTRAEG